MPKYPPNPRRSPVRTLQAILGGRPIRIEHDLDSNVADGALRRLGHMLHFLIVGIHRTHLTRMAAALSYRTMFGLIPVVVVVAVALAAFTSQQTQQTVIRNLLTYAGLDKIKVEAPAPSPNSGLDQPSQPQTPTTVESARLDEWINTKAVEIAAKIKSLPFNIIGLVAILTLIYAAISMLVEIEQAFNDIYNAPEGRGWVRRIVQYWTLLTLGPVLLIASFAITHSLSNTAESFAEMGGSFREHILSVLRFVGATAVSTVLLLVIYATVPNTRVQLGPAALGALVAGALWEAGKLAFTRYVDFATSPSSSTNFGSLYGALAILPLFLIWVYLSWLIVLFGLELAYTTQTYRQATAQGLTRSVLAALGLIEEVQPPQRPRLVDPAAGLIVLVNVAQRFTSGQPSDHNQVARETGLDEQAVGELLERLADAGFLHRVHSPGERLATYTLARPPGTIAALDALRVGEDMTSPRPASTPPDSVAALIARTRAGALAGKTVADFLEPTPSPAHLSLRPAPVPTT
jgi:membrane protein